MYLLAHLFVLYTDGKENRLTFLIAQFSRYNRTQPYNVTGAMVATPNMLFFEYFITTVRVLSLV